MPIDPRIPLLAEPPATVDVAQTMGRGLALRQAFEQAKQDAQDRQDQQAAQQTIAQSGGNLDTAIQTLYQRGLARPAMALEAVRAKRQKDAGDLLKTTLGNESERYNVVSKAANGITDQASQDATIARLKATDPQTADVMAQTLGPTYNPDNVTKAQTISLNAKESADMKHQAAIAYQESQKTSQDGVKFLSSMLAGTPQEHWDTVYQHAPSFVGPDVIKTVQGMVQTPDQAKALAIGPAKQAELAATASTQARIEQHQTTQEGMERQRLGLEGARVGMERQKMNQEQQANAAAMKAADPNASHGVDFLKSLPDPIAAQVKALDEGRMQFPSSFALKTPYWQQMLSNVAQYDPNFDAVNYNARAKTRAAFTSGKEGQQINAMNTAIGHLGQLADKVTEMGNSSLTPVNMLANPLSKLGGSSKVTNFDTVREAVIDEATRVYRQAGGSEGDIKARREQMADTNSPSQLYDAIRETANLIKSKIDSSQSQYEQGMGMAKADIPILQPHAQQALQKLDALAGKKSTASTLGPAEGDTQPIPGYPNAEQTFKNGKWIRTK